MNFVEAMTAAQSGFDTWAAKLHNKKWAKMIYHTPIPNDLLVNIAEAFCRASPAVAPVAVSVKGLEWQEGEWQSVATEPFGAWYFVHQRGDDWRIHYGDHKGYPTRESAKAAAQADFNARILSSIIPATKGGEVEAAKLPRLTEKMLRAACKAHYGDDNIDGVALTPADIDYSFRDAFKRMWSGVRAALSPTLAVPHTDVAAAIHALAEYHEIGGTSMQDVEKELGFAPLPTGYVGEAEPYAHEYGKTNGDGTYSIVIERGVPKSPVRDWPIKPLFAAPPKPVADTGVDAFEMCAEEAESQAELIEQMRGVYPGDPHGALGRDANKMRKLAKAIRALRPAALAAASQRSGE
jgi:hypothetical protein